MKQLQLLPTETMRHHGGELSIGKRKAFRPLSKSDPVHIILKARRFIRHKKGTILEELQHQAKKFGVRIYRASVNLDHLHFAAKLPDRSLYRGFIRALTGRLAQRLGKNLWHLLPFTRVTNGKRDIQAVFAYIEMNEREAQGEPKRKRRDPYRNERPKKRKPG